MKVWPITFLLLALLACGDAVLCRECVDFLDEAEGELLDLVIQYGISKGCAICGDLKSKPEQEVCGLLCEIVGIEAFVKILRSSDIDPIYVCSELGSCPRNTCVNDCTTIQSMTIVPPSGPLGTKFNVTVTIQALNNTGTGTTWMTWHCPTSGETGTKVLNTGFSRGSTIVVSQVIDTQQDACLYSPALYSVLAVNCAYDCTDPHGVVYAAQKASFQIT